MLACPPIHIGAQYLPELTCSLGIWDYSGNISLFNSTDSLPLSIIGNAVAHGNISIKQPTIFIQGLKNDLWVMGLLMYIQRCFFLTVVGTLEFIKANLSLQSAYSSFLVDGSVVIGNSSGVYLDADNITHLIGGSKNITLIRGQEINGV